ncbi:MAG: cell wall-binding repeat-containing protein, partial [Peptococcaceae bacterium]|nr:cell wall-binding repeat-containing protein [Peptococcaceae bacterium]
MKKVTLLSVIASTSLLFLSFAGSAQAAPRWGQDQTLVPTLFAPRWGQDQTTGPSLIGPRRGEDQPDNQPDNPSLIAPRWGQDQTTGPSLIAPRPGEDHSDNPSHSEGQRDHYGRITGSDRFGTSTQIAQNLYGNQIQNIVVASGNNYADALSAGDLAKKLNAPIILVNSSVHGSKDAMDYIESHLAQGGNIYIVGGQGTVPTSMSRKFRDMNYEVHRLGGQNRYQTDSQVVSQLNVPLNTPVVLASGNGYADALGISSIAASKGWPILLTDKRNLDPSVKAFITNDQPSQVYIIGGNGVISSKISSTVKDLVPNTTITRLGGADRFATLAEILDTFYPHPSQIYVANGTGYADALSGSPLAASQDAPILLVNPHSNQLPPAIVTYLLQLRAAGVQPQITSLGGTAAVPDALLQQIANYLGEQGTSQTTTPTPQSDVITGTLNQTSVASSVVTVNLSTPFTYINATQYQIYISGNAASAKTAIGSATT